MKLENFLVPIFFLLVINIAANSQPVLQHGKLSVEGIYLTNEKGEAITLTGVSYGWHNWWPRFYNEESVAWFAKDWGCSVVRAAMGIGPRGSYFDKKEWSLEKIEAVIKGAIENNIYVIIDWHSHGIFTEEAKQFFSKMAEKYGHYPHIIYEIFNEPVHDSWEKIKEYSIEVIKAIREHDPDNIILVGSPHWDQDVHIVADSPIEGFSNLMYTLHFYAATHSQFLRVRGDYAISKGIPLFVSECAGMEATGDGPINHEEFKNWTDWMEKHKISSVFWSIADKNETCSMLTPQAGDSGNWEENVIKEWGVIVRSVTRKAAGLD